VQKLNKGSDVDVLVVTNDGKKRIFTGKLSDPGKKAGILPVK